jgi:hypothetical protein
LITCGVIDGMTNDEQASLAKEVREKALGIGDKRSFSQMDSFLKKMEQR